MFHLVRRTAIFLDIIKAFQVVSKHCYMGEGKVITLIVTFNQFLQAQHYRGSSWAGRGTLKINNSVI